MLTKLLSMKSNKKFKLLLQKLPHNSNIRALLLFTVVFMIFG